MLTLVLFFVHLAISFNVDTNFPIVYTAPTKVSNKSSYFGYSVVLYRGKNDNISLIFIGAPRDTDPHINYDNPGACYKCKIKGFCRQVNISGNKVSLKTGHKQKLDDAWIGGAMDVSHEQERVVACAHRWIRVRPENADYLMQGACYSVQVNNSNVETLLPLVEYKKDWFKKHHFYFYGQSGTSVHIPPKRNELILGAPGVYLWFGTSILYRGSEGSKSTVNQQEKGDKWDVKKSKLYDYKNIAFPLTSDGFGYFGYSITSGYFYHKEKFYYASGAPRASSYRGKVFVYNFNEIGNSKPIIKEFIEGNQFGEYFGASLTSGDINNDGYDDLIVGAPFSIRDKLKYNEGKVYVFLGGKTFSGLTTSRNIFGTSSNSQFGTCVQYLEDINSDGFGDIAVSAPYEEDTGGVVYIYRGTESGIDTKYIQRIIGKEILPGIRGFGISISKPADIDYNNYSDIAVGAYLSGHVVILRTYPVVTINHDLLINFLYLNHLQNSFVISACFWFISNHHLSTNVSIIRTITLDEELQRAQMKNSNLTTNLSLVQGELFCENFVVTFEPVSLDRPITVSLTHQLVTERKPTQVFLVSNGTEERDEFCSICPVEDKFKSTSVSTRQIPFALGCGTDNFCNSSLEFEPMFNDTGENNTFVLGSKDNLTLNIFVQNLGENAYMTKVIIFLPTMVDFQNTLSNCIEENSTVLSCIVDNPLETNRSMYITLVLDMTIVNNGYQENFLVFKIMLEANGNVELNNIKQLHLKVERNADVFISGRSREELRLYKHEETSISFIQTYFVEIFGSSLVDEIVIEIYVPHFISVNNNNFQIVDLYHVTGKLDDREIISCLDNCTNIVGMNSKVGNLKDHKVVEKRSITQSEASNKSVAETELNIPSRIFHINCTKTEVNCSKILWSTGPLREGQIIRIDINMILDISVVEGFMEENEVISFTTQSRVQVTNPSHFKQSGDRPDEAEVTLRLVRGTDKELIPSWIILLSVIAGLLLLLLLTIGLYKNGFFRRVKKEELEQIKKQVRMDEENDETNGQC